MNASPTPPVIPGWPGLTFKPERVQDIDFPRATRLPVPYPVPGKIQRYAEGVLKKYDTNGSGELEAAESEKLPGNLKLIDYNRDKIVTADELARYITRYGRAHRLHLLVPGSAPSGETVAELPLFEPASKTGLQQTPTAALPESMMQDEWDESEVDEFTEFDENGMPILEPPTSPSGTYPYGSKRRRSMQKFYTSPHRLPPGVPDWFRQRDLDGDGQVTLAEYAPVATRTELLEFSRYDLDRDGVITVKEVMPFARSTSSSSTTTGAASATSATSKSSSAYSSGSTRSDGSSRSSSSKKKYSYRRP